MDLARPHNYCGRPGHAGPAISRKDAVTDEPDRLHPRPRLRLARWRAGADWYQNAFPLARRIHHQPDDFGHLQVGAVALEIVEADSKVASGAAGSVVYWAVADLDAAIAHFAELGAALYRGPLALPEGGRMCQVRDPWGNCIGLREAAAQCQGS